MFKTLVYTAAAALVKCFFFWVVFLFAGLLGVLLHAGKSAFFFNYEV